MINVLSLFDGMSGAQIALERAEIPVLNYFASEIDKFAAVKVLFKQFMEKSDWEKYYKEEDTEEKTRVIVLVSDIENLVLHQGYTK